jgi:hypothetical protein
MLTPLVLSSHFKDGKTEFQRSGMIHSREKYNIIAAQRYFSPVKLCKEHSVGN